MLRSYLSQPPPPPPPLSRGVTDNKQVEEHLLPADRTRWVSEREMRDGLIPAKHGWDEFNLVGDFKRVLMQGFTAHVYDDLGVKSVHKVWLDDVHLRLYAAVEKRTRLMCDDDEDDAGGSTGDEHGLELNDISDVKRGTRCHQFAVARANLGALAASDTCYFYTPACPVGVGGGVRSHQRMSRRRRDIHALM